MPYRSREFRDNIEDAVGHALIAGLLYGLVVTDEFGTVLWCSNTAKELLETDCGITLRNGFLVTTHAEDQRILARFLAEACSDRTQNNSGAVGVVVLQSDRRIPAYASVRAMQITNGRNGNSMRAALIVISDSRNVAESLMAKAANAFGFSKAEQRTALGLLAGMTATEIAYRFSKSLETIRSNIKHICGKMGLTRQAEVTEALFALPMFRGQLRKPPEDACKESDPRE